jgi:hypothetical protein
VSKKGREMANCERCDASLSFLGKKILLVNSGFQFRLCVIEEVRLGIIFEQTRSMLTTQFDEGGKHVIQRTMQNRSLTS